MDRLEYAALTHPGRVLDNNEDNFYIHGQYKQSEQEQSFAAAGRVTDGCLTAMVCDGMGGYSQGERASLTAVRLMAKRCAAGPGKGMLWTILPWIISKLPIPTSVRYEKMSRSFLGTTMAALEFCDGRVMAVNVGDSRIYRLRNGELLQLSVDHTVVARMVKMGQLTPEEARCHAMRHRITQNIGLYPEELVLEPAVLQQEPVKGKDLYLICSDGLTDMVEDEKIKEILSQDERPEIIVRELIQKAVDAGGKDNVTALVVRVCRSGGFWHRLGQHFRKENKSISADDLEACGADDANRQVEDER